MIETLNCWDVFIDTVKDVGILIGLIAGVAAMIANWKLIFSPYKQKRTEEEFNTTKELINELLQPTFLIFYNAPIRRKDKQTLISILTIKLISPFLPIEIKGVIKDMIKILTDGSDNNIITTENSNDIINDIDQKALIKSHKDLIQICAKLLKIEYKEFPFTIFEQ